MVQGVAPYSVFVRGVRTALNATNHLDGLSPGRYDVQVHDSKGTVREAMFEIGSGAYGVCSELAKCSQYMIFKDDRYHASCLARLIGPAFVHPMPWDDCAMRALHGLSAHVRRLRLDHGRDFVRMILRLGFSIYPTKCFLRRCSPVSVSRIDLLNSELLRRWLMPSKNRATRISKLLISLSLRENAANHAAFMLTTQDNTTMAGDGPVGLLSATTPWKMSAALPLKFPLSLLVDSELAAMFVRKVVEVMGVRDLVPMDRVAHYVVARTAIGSFKYDKDHMASVLQLPSAGLIGGITAGMQCDPQVLMEIVRKTKVTSLLLLFVVVVVVVCCCCCCLFVCCCLLLLLFVVVVVCCCLLLFVVVVVCCCCCLLLLFVVVVGVCCCCCCLLLLFVVVVCCCCLCVFVFSSSFC